MLFTSVTACDPVHLVDYSIVFPLDGPPSTAMEPQGMGVRANLQNMKGKFAAVEEIVEANGFRRDLHRIDKHNEPSCSNYYSTREVEGKRYSRTIGLRLCLVDASDTMSIHIFEIGSTKGSPAFHKAENDLVQSIERRFGEGSITRSREE